MDWSFQRLFMMGKWDKLPWLTYKQFSNLIGNLTDMIVAEENWQPMIDEFWNNRNPDDYSGSSVHKRDFNRLWYHDRNHKHLSIEEIAETGAMIEGEMLFDIPNPAAEFETKVLHKIRIEQFERKLTEQDRQILRMRMDGRSLKDIKSKFLGLPVVHIGIVYAIIQTVAFAVFLFVPALPAWIAIVVCAIIAGVSAVCMISADAGRNEIERVDAKVQKKVFYIRELQADVELIAAAETDAYTKAALTQLAEKILFSDPMSNEQLTDLENNISTKVLELKTAANKVEIITELNSLLDERNRKCKIFRG